MPRASKDKSNANGPPSNHPQENYKDHRKFLVRSLERNDVDLAALVELNDTLRNAKEAILQSCGELVLLDLGAGKLKLVKDELHEATNDDKEEMKHHLTPAQKQLCVDFLLRMKLRRKLSNRLARRLNRVAHAMDGEDVTPPPPPKFGDLRLRIDPSEVTKRADQWKSKEEVKKRVQQRRAEIDAQRLEKLRSAKLLEQQQEKDKKAKEEREVEMKAKEEREEEVKTKEEEEETKEEQKEEMKSEKKVNDGEPEGKDEQKEPETVGKEEESKEEGTKDVEMKDVETKEGETKDAPTEEKVDKESKLDEKPTESKSESTKEEEKTIDIDKEGESEAASPMQIQSSTQQESEQTPDAVESLPPIIKPDPQLYYGTIPPELEQDYESLKEYDTAYEKKWDPVLKKFNYSLAAALAETDHKAKNYGVGIGAGARVMSEQEREQEFNRWETTLLARIPEQPTFKELGLENRVFFLEERRKRCLEANKETEEDPDVENENEEQAKKKLKQDHNSEDESKEESESTQKVQVKKVAGKELRKQDEGKKDEDENMSKDEEDDKKDKNTDKDDESSNSSDMFGSENSTTEQKTTDSKENEEKSSTKDDSDGDDSSDMFDADEDENGDKSDENGDKSDEKEKDDLSDSKDDKAENNEVKTEEKEKEKDDEESSDAPAEKSDAVEEQPKRVRVMSLAAVPTFYEQDMIRIRMLHGDLVSSSMLEHAKVRLASVTRDYNNALRKSNEYLEHRSRLQQSLSFFIAKSRSDIAKVNNDHAVAVAVAKQRWVKKKQEMDRKLVKTALPSLWGRAPFGTNMTQNYSRNHGIAQVIGQCLADVVDGAILIGEGKIPKQKMEPFVPPPKAGTNAQTGETLQQQHMRMERELRRQMNESSGKLSASEEERKKAWKKMMKTKAELEFPPGHGTTRRGRVEMSNYQQTPLPPLRSGAQAMPREYDFARAGIATYTPPTNNVNFAEAYGGESNKKYSAARVRDRISADGSVAPVTEPKKTKDGLYQRPAGRTRKGMQWDAVRGIWVPEGSQ